MSMYRDYLMHHGIMGMRWGVHNGPPYPLDKKLSRRIQAGKNEKARVSAKEYRDMRSGKIKTTKKDRVAGSHIASDYYRRQNMRKKTRRRPTHIRFGSPAISSGYDARLRNCGRTRGKRFC